MRAKRILITIAVVAGAVLVLAAVVELNPPIQTWIARRALASIAPGATLERASIGLSRMSVWGLRLESEDAVLVVPQVKVEMGVLSAGLGRGLLAKSIVATDWTLDLSHSDVSRMNPGATEETPWVARIFGFAFAAFNIPSRLTLDTVDLEGTVILSDGEGSPVGKARVVVTGGGLAPRRDGRFHCTMTAALNDSSAPVSVLLVNGNLTAAMDASATFTRAEFTMEATASGRQFPSGVGLAGEASAERAGRKVSYSLSLKRGSERIASIDASTADGSRRMSGAWRLDLKDTDLAPFLLGRSLPAFNVAGGGAYDVDAGNGDVHALGKIQASADRLGVVGRDLAPLGAIKLAAEFDMARIGNSLRVDRLETSLSDAGPVASLLALQPFEFNTASGELKVARPSGDLVGISVKALPVSWLMGAFPRLDVVGSDFRGEFAMRAEDGRLALRTKAPLMSTGVAALKQGRPIASNLELSAFVLADYASQGWQVQLAPFAVSSQGLKLLSLEARIGRLAGKQQAIKAEGSWSAALPAWLSQPARVGLPRFSKGDASGSFEANLGATREVRVRLALKDLALESDAALALPSVTADIRADFGPNGRSTFNAPLHLAYDARSADLGLSGSFTSDSQGPRVDAALTGSQLSTDDLRVAAALCGLLASATDSGHPGGSADPGRPKAAGPFWPEGRAILSVHLENVALPHFLLSDLRGGVALDPDSLKIDSATARLGDGSGARFDGELLFSRSDAQKPYSFRANVAANNVDSAPLFRAIDPDETPEVEGRFDFEGRLKGRALAAADLMDEAQGECTVSSKGGQFRILRTDAIEPLKQTPSKLADALDTVTALFGKKADKPADAVADLAGGLSEIHYDQMNIRAERGPDLDIHFTEINMIAPEERMTGTGTIAYAAGVPIQGQPLGIDLGLSVRGRPGMLLGIVGLLKDGPDELGYTPLSQPIHIGGTLKNVDESQWREMLINAPLRKAAGLFDKLLGR
jgi:hypothetical protein